GRAARTDIRSIRNHRPLLRAVRGRPTTRLSRLGDHHMTAAVAPIRVVVVDDHPLFRIGIISLLETLDGVEVVGSAETADEAAEVVRETAPAVVLMDLDLAGGSSGIDATRRITRAHPEVGVLVLTMLGDDDSLFAAVRSGARGYL